MGPASGKSIVALGLVELLSRRVSRVGFYRPVVQAIPDNVKLQVDVLYDRQSGEVGLT